jgi:DNA-binding response OmpR family regulator
MKTDSAAARIFIVEDEALISMELADRLLAMGYDPCGHATRSDTAVERILESKPDLVLMDINLVGHRTGIDTAEELRGHLDVPVIFLTAYSDAELVAKAIRTEPFGYLIKPFDERELGANIEAALFKHAMEQKLRETNRLLEQRNNEVEAVNRQLQEALAAVKELRGILPICMSCRKVRDDQDYWQSVEAYICEHTDAQFSHGICPDCFEAYKERYNLGEGAPDPAV